MKNDASETFACFWPVYLKREFTL